MTDIIPRQTKSDFINKDLENTNNNVFSHFHIIIRVMILKIYHDEFFSNEIKISMIICFQNTVILF